MARDDTVLRAYQRAQAYAAQRRYAAMPESAQRAYAARHPEFMSRFGNVVPEHIRFAMADAADDDAADAIWDRYVRARNLAATRRHLARQRVSFGERVILVCVAALVALFLGALLCGVLYVAAGHHGVITGAAITLAAYAVYAVPRLLSGSR